MINRVKKIKLSSQTGFVSAMLVLVGWCFTPDRGVAFIPAIVSMLGLLGILFAGLIWLYERIDD